MNEANAANASIVQRFLEYSNQLKLYHWKTSSHSRHVSSDALYSDLQSGMDRFVEAYIGRYGRDSILADGATTTLKMYDDSQGEQLLNDLVVFLERDIPSHIKDPDLLNIRDEILASVEKTKYLFTHGGSSNSKYSKMRGGTIFDMSFKMPIMSFLYALLIMMIISIFLGIIVISVFGVAWIAGLNENVYFAAVVGALYAMMSLYAPLDYIYTMGLNAK